MFQHTTGLEQQIERGVIEHPGSLVIVPLQDENVLMLKQYRLALDETILELPAGTRIWDEDWQTCAQREIREETGYRAAKWIPLGHVWPAPGITDELMAIYLAAELTWDPLPADEDEEIELLRLVHLFPEVVEGAALNREPHRLAYYLQEVATKFHQYYNKHRFLTEDRALSIARLCLVRGIRTVIANGLGLIGVSAPESM